MFHVYTITNMLTGHTYVGQTRNGYERWIQHLGKLRKGLHFNAYLQHAFTKYTEAAFVFALLGEYRTTEECCAAESAAIANALASGLCYNLKTQVTVHGGILLAEVRQRMSLSHTGAANYQYGKRGTDNANFGSKRTPEQRKRLRLAKVGAKNPMWGTSSPNKGRRTSAATKAKISAARTGQTLSAEQRAAVSARLSGAGNPFFGRRHSAASIEKMRAAHKGQPSPMKGKHHSAEARGKLSTAAKGRPSLNKGQPSPNRGRVLSAETRHKMSDAKRAWWAKRKVQSNA